MGSRRGRTDLNKDAETILIPLLNEVYGWSLTNLNSQKNNYPSIDLADEAAGISIQVTATPTLDKVKKTLRKFIEHNQYLKYPRLIIFILRHKEKSYPNASIQGIVQSKFDFEPQRDILDHCDVFEEICKFEIAKTLRVEEILEAYFGEDQKSTSLFASWQETCRGMLDRQIQFPTLNDLMAKDGVRIDPSLFVPVGLVERTQKQYQRADLGSAEQGSQLLQPIEEEIVKRFNDDEEFFSQVICNADLSNHSRLVITGEPGAGKTTLLQKIGDRLCQAGMFPIWFSLGKSGVLPTYECLSRVLKENAQPRNFESSHWDASINALLQTGKVWLLLDGADEFTTNGNPLHVIGAQLREAWASQVKVVLTCRLNAWDTYALPEFKVFRTLEFDYQTPVDGYSNQVEAYIYRFFTKDGVDPQLGNTLIQQLHLPGKESFRASVKNPLRLSLLCYIWEAGIGELPDTKAELYRFFVEYYYDLQELKHPEIRIDRTERDTLNLALGEVAKAALNSRDSRFRLRKSLIEAIPTMGKESAKDSLFDKAVRLGWLNRIGTTAEKPREAAYAFFHTTFQEYFAALAINDWHFFLNHTPENPNHPDASYRIFESHWQEVMILWFGCQDKRTSQQQKEQFIEELTDFEDISGKYGFYNRQAYLIAARGIGQYESSKVYKIADQIVKWSFGYFDSTQQQWMQFAYYLQKEAKSAFLETHRQAAVAALTSLLPTIQHKFILLDVIEYLWRIDPGNSLVLKTLEELTNANQDKFVFEHAAEFWWEIDPGNEVLLERVINLDVQDELGCRRLHVKLEEFDKDIAIQFFTKLTKLAQTKENRFDASVRLLKINKNDCTAVSTLIEILQLANADDPGSITLAKAAAWHLEKFGKFNPIIVSALEELIQDSQEEIPRAEAAICLARVNPKNEITLKTLDNLIQTSQNAWIRWHVAKCLGEISSHQQLAIETLEELAQAIKVDSAQLSIAKDLQKIVPNNSVSVSVFIELIQSSEDDITRQLAIDYLAKIDLPRATALLKKLTQTVKYESIRWRVTHELSELDPENHLVKPVLQELIQTAQDGWTRYEAAASLLDIDPANQLAIQALIELVKTSRQGSSDASTQNTEKFFADASDNAADKLIKSIKVINIPDVITSLISCISDDMLKNDREKFIRCHSVVGHCTQNISYSDFYRVWHSSSSANSELFIED